jgi:peroxiredoxin Q/BCP
VLGVSPDPVEAVKKFHHKQGLDFSLLPTPTMRSASDGVWAEKTTYGRPYWGARRSTFVIDPEGTVATVIPKVSPNTHDEVVLAAVAELAAA